MSSTKEFPFDRARRLTAAEVRSGRRAIERILGVKRKGRGRPPEPVAEKYHPISIRLDPRIIRWAKDEGRRRGLKYQSIINKALLQIAA